MELKEPGRYRSQYLSALAADNYYNDIIKELTNKPLNVPNYNFRYMEAEQAPDFKNKMRELQELLLDMNVIDAGVRETTSYIDSIIANLDNTAAAIKEIVDNEEERLKDLNILCGIDDEYNMIIPIYASDFGSDENYTVFGSKILGCHADKLESVDYEVASVSGNGYLGDLRSYDADQHVFVEYEENDPGIMAAVDDNSNIEYMTDDNDVSAFAYSRYTTTDKMQAMDEVINYDDKDVEVNLTLTAKKDFCALKLLSDTPDLRIKSLEISNDGISYNKYINYTIDINNNDKNYNEHDYINGSGIICFPMTSYVRIVLVSGSVTADYLWLTEKDEERLLENIQQKSLKINNIKLFTGSFTETDITTDDLLEAGAVDAAGIFVNELIPAHFSGSRYVKYYLIVNGEEYEVEPVNSMRNGVKLVKFNENESSNNAESYAKIISETIKSLKIRITMLPEDAQETPYIGNIKLCLGKDTSSIYVTE